MSCSAPKDGLTPDHPPGMPRWVKVLALGGAVALVVVVIVMLLIGGEHGPGMHGG